MVPSTVSSLRSKKFEHLRNATFTPDGFSHVYLGKPWKRFHSGDAPRWEWAGSDLANGLVNLPSWCCLLLLGESDGLNFQAYYTQHPPQAQDGEEECKDVNGSHEFGKKYVSYRAFVLSYGGFLEWGYP